MLRSKKVAGALALTLGLVGCDSFLTGPGLSENPNSAVAATPTQLFVAMEANQFVQNEGQLARTASMYVQQLSGTFNQQLAYGSQYLMGEQEFIGWWAGVYTGGGLVDLRKIQAGAKANNDPRLEGMAKVWEAYVMGMAASEWGDIPYREAIGDNPAPHLDPQQQVYADVQKLLDDAIVLLGNTAAPGAGVAEADLVYGANAGRWIRLAYTLKARFYLHTAERVGQAAYQAALDNAQKGINEAPNTLDEAMHGQAAGDFRTRHDNELEKANIWAQFLKARQDMVAGKFMVDLLKSRNDPRLAAYFDPASDGVYRGADQFGRTLSQPMSEVDNPTRRSFTFRQPMVTWTENELIKAEALFQLGRNPEALAAVNNVRGKLGLSALTGPVTLAQIMEEKYIALYQNVEAWNDYKRTCLPKLTPGGPSASYTPAKEIPRRFVYSRTERLNNPNIPLPNNVAANNWNDPNPCT